jgi:hypothetical protein
LKSLGRAPIPFAYGTRQKKETAGVMPIWLEAKEKNFFTGRGWRGTLSGSREKPENLSPSVPGWMSSTSAIRARGNPAKTILDLRFWILDSASADSHFLQSKI